MGLEIREKEVYLHPRPRTPDLKGVYHACPRARRGPWLTNYDHRSPSLPSPTPDLCLCQTKRALQSSAGVSSALSADGIDLAALRASGWLPAAHGCCPGPAPAPPRAHSPGGHVSAGSVRGPPGSQWPLSRHSMQERMSEGLCDWT